MSSADLLTVVIACPHCGTRYQVPPATIGADGRDVQCAHCGRNWHAKAEAPPPPPPPPKPVAKPAAVKPATEDALFAETDEAALDSAFEAEAGKAAPTAPAEKAMPRSDAANGPDPDPAVRAAAEPPAALDAAAHKRAVTSFNRRQQSLLKALPMARVRRLARVSALVALVLLLGVGLGFRADIVRSYPALAGLYGAIGMPVNIVGLTFEDTKTLSSLRNGQSVMQISAKIRSVAGGPVRVPPVIVSLLSAAGKVLYEWTVTPDVAEMEPGEVQEFSTQVNTPPDGAVRVRLRFTAKA